MRQLALFIMYIIHVMKSIQIIKFIANIFIINSKLLYDYIEHNLYLL